MRDEPERRIGRARVWLRADPAPALEAAGIDDPERMVATLGVRRRFSGRGHPALVDLPRPDGGPAVPIVVRAYRRGGALRGLAPTLFFTGDRALEEVEALEAAADAGVATVRAVAAVRRPARIGYRAWLVTEEVPDAHDLLVRLHERAAGDVFDPSPTIEAVGRAFRRLHDAGLSVPDLHVKNVLVPSDAPGEPVLVDFDRARVTGRPLSERARVTQLGRFDRSLEKAVRAGARVSHVERARLVRGYLGATHLDADVRRRALAHHRKHLARHRLVWRLTGR